MDLSSPVPGWNSCYDGVNKYHRFASLESVKSVANQPFVNFFLYTVNFSEIIFRIGQRMSSQLTIFFLFFGGLQGLLFSFFLIKKKLHRSGYIFLLLYFGVILLQITLKLMSKGWLMENWKLLYGISYQLPFLYGPLLYLFVRQIMHRQFFRWADLLHFTPFLVLSLFFGLGYAYPESPIMLFPLLLAKFRLILQLVSIYVYHWFALQFLRPGSPTEAYTSTQQARWLKKFVYASLVVCSSVALVNYFMMIFYPDLNYLRPVFLVLTLFIYWISYEALSNPDVFGVIRGYGQSSDSETDGLPRLTVHRPSRKYVRSNLAPAEADRIGTAVETLMKQQKTFLNPELNIDQLASLVSTNRHHLSQVLNENFKKSFYDYVNAFRVEEAKCLLSDPQKNNHKISSIAYDAGFNSLSTFNDVFRKIAGSTPSHFRKQSEAIVRKKRV